MKKFGLLGEKLEHSYSKEIHELFFKSINLSAKYDMIEKKSDELEKFIEKLKSNEYEGINVTVPYKVEIIKYLDEISEKAKNIGAVNTIIVKNNKLVGDNTDYFGFLQILENNNIQLKNKKVLILGTGGSAKAIYNVLIDKNVEKIFLATLKENNNFKRRKSDRIIHYSEIKNLKDIELIVNCTPVGMYPNIDMCPLIDENTVDTKYLIDIIYNPKETVLMKKYKLRGSKVIGGIEMLIAQALKSEESWNNVKIIKENILFDIYNELEKKLYK